jgi:hypothetical protein
MVFLVAAQIMKMSIPFQRSHNCTSSYFGADSATKTKLLSKVLRVVGFDKPFFDPSLIIKTNIIVGFGGDLHCRCISESQLISNLLICTPQIEDLVVQ